MRLRRRIAIMAFLALGLSGAACRREHPAAPSAQPLEGVRVAKCGAVLRGPVCEIATDGKLSVFVPGGSGAVSIDIDGHEVGRAELSSESGKRFELAAPPGARMLTVTATRHAEARSFRLRLAPPAPVPAWLDEARKKKEQGAFDEAARALDDAERSGAPNVTQRAADIGSLRARLALARGQTEAAARELASSARQHVERGAESRAVDDFGTLAYVLITDRRRAAEAREAIARMRDYGTDYAEGEALASYYDGLLASETGDAAHALARLGEARAQAERLGVDKITRSVATLEANTLVSIGRAREARDRLFQLEAEQGASMTPCERGTLVLNMAWAALLAREAPGATNEAEPDPLPALVRAVELFAGPCANPRLGASALVNLAQGQLERGDPASARATLARARAAVAHPRPLLALAELETEGRIALAERDARGALRAFDALARAAAGVSRLDEEAAEEGRARAYRLAGDRPGALAAARRAPAMLDEAARAIPVGEGRGAFFWARERVAQMLVELLLDDDRPAEALEALRADRARMFADSRRLERVEALAPDARARWEQALAEYRSTRDAIVAEANDDWSRSGESLERTLRERRARDVAARARLEETASALFESSAKDPRPLPPLARDKGVVGLAFLPLDSVWAEIVVRDGSVRAKRIAAPLDAARSRETAATLLAAAADVFAGATRIRVLAFGPMRDVDLSAVEVDGQPLVVHAAIEYPLDLGGVEAAGDDAGGASLVVADPTGTLPAARREGAAVAARLGGDGGDGAVLVQGAEATRARLLEALARASSFHFAGHASYAGTDGWESALQLAGSERLTVADVLALPHAPRRVVLSGCETGVEGERAGGPAGLGLADAFLAAGSRSVVASTRRVDDATTDRLMRALTDTLAREPNDVAQALRRAQLEVRSADPTADWSAFRTYVR